MKRTQSFQIFQIKNENNLISNLESTQFKIKDGVIFLFALFFCYQKYTQYKNKETKNTNKNRLEQSKNRTVWFRV